jgi:signal transduction histidine kinase
MMDRQLGQMVRLVDDLLDVSRITQGKIELRRARIELASAVHHAVEAARSLVESRKHDLTVSGKAADRAGHLVKGRNASRSSVAAE